MINWALLISFSCKRRRFCPSCPEKGTLNLADHLNEEVYEDVPHRQFVFTIRRRFRLYFRYNRYLLSDLTRCAWQMIQNVYGFAPGEEYKPGMVGTIQTFGSLILWNPHFHTIVTDGRFLIAEHSNPLPFQSWRPK